MNRNIKLKRKASSIYFLKIKNVQNCISRAHIYDSFYQNSKQLAVCEYIKNNKIFKTHYLLIRFFEKVLKRIFIVNARF